MSNVAQALMIMLNMHIMIQQLSRFDEINLDPKKHNQLGETTNSLEENISPKLTQV